MSASATPAHVSPCGESAIHVPTTTTANVAIMDQMISSVLTVAIPPVFAVVVLCLLTSTRSNRLESNRDARMLPERAAS